MYYEATHHHSTTTQSSDTLCTITVENMPSFVYSPYQEKSSKYKEVKFQCFYCVLYNDGSKTSCVPNISFLCSGAATLFPPITKLLNATVIFMYYEATHHHSTTTQSSDTLCTITVENMPSFVYSPYQEKSSKYKEVKFQCFYCVLYNDGSKTSCRFQTFLFFVLVQQTFFPSRDKGSG